MMQTFKTKNGVEIRIPSTGDEWELYTSSMGCSKAARGLTGGLKRAFRHIESQVRQGKTIIQAVSAGTALMNKVQCKYAEYGAADSEPNMVRAHAISQFVKARWGIGTDGDSEVYDIARWG